MTIIIFRPTCFILENFTHIYISENIYMHAYTNNFAIFFLMCTFVFLTFYIFCQTFVELKKVEDVFNPLHNSIL